MAYGSVESAFCSLKSVQVRLGKKRLPRKDWKFEFRLRLKQKLQTTLYKNYKKWHSLTMHPRFSFTPSYHV